jgi:hypothetical protein
MRLSAADRAAAAFLAEQVAVYGPLTRGQVADYAARLRDGRIPVGFLDPPAHVTAYGLEVIASRMAPGDVVSGAIPWRRRA